MDLNNELLTVTETCMFCGDETGMKSRGKSHCTAKPGKTYWESLHIQVNFSLWKFQSLYDPSVEVNYIVIAKRKVL